jgi:5'-phosphate synthase pdxT subunit
MLRTCGAEVQLVKTGEDLAVVDALVIPGGESTTIGMLATRENLIAPLRERISSGMPTLGTCAGLIFLAKDLIDARPDQVSIGALDATVRRNAFGRQVDSFEQDVQIQGLAGPFHAVFIRAPWVEKVGQAVEVLATVAVNSVAEDKIVMVRQANVFATAFHPELTKDSRVHEMFCKSI